MIFNLPPICGFIPLIVYLVLAIRKKPLLVAATLSFLTACIITGQSFMDVGSLLQGSLKEFVATVGFIIMLGSGLGEVLKRTGVAQNLVYLSISKLKIKTYKKALFFFLIITTVLVALLGTLAGATAVLAPVLVPIAATLGIAPGALGIVMVAGGLAGMVLGPFTPTAVTIRTLSNVTMAENYLYGCGPLALIIMTVCYIFAVRLQEKGGDGEAYTEEDKATTTDYKPTPESKRATLAFLLSMLVLIIYGILNSAGASFAITVMLVMAVIVGFSGKLTTDEIITTFTTGAGRMFKMFLLFIMFAPVLTLIKQSGAYDALVELLSPLFNIGSDVPFVMSATAAGIWGISGAAVAQCQIIYDVFYPFAQGLALDPIIWNSIMAYGCVLTSMAIPNGDVMGPLGLAHSTNVNGVLKAGYATIAVALIVLLVRTVI